MVKEEKIKELEERIEELKEQNDLAGLVMNYSILKDICKLKAIEALEKEEDVNLEEVNNWKKKTDEYKQLEKETLSKMSSNEINIARQFNLIPLEKKDKELIDITDIDVAIERIETLENKVIEIVYREKLNTENIKVGMILPDSTTKPKLWYIDDELIVQMRAYYISKGKSAIWNNKITGRFLEFKYYDDNPKK